MALIIPQQPKSKADVMAQLRKEILPLEGFKPLLQDTVIDAGLGPIKNAFPNATFPIGAIHEFLCAGKEDVAATTGFIAGIASSLMTSRGTLLWISSQRTVFPTALKSFGIAPERIIFIDLEKEKEVLWVIEEALKCDGLTAVIGEMKELNFTASRRLQLAVEKSLVTGFILRHNPRNVNTNACISRWKIKSIPSEPEDKLPGVGFPSWNVELIKMRSGKPGAWQLKWTANRFQLITKDTILLHHQQQKKTG